MMKTWDELKSGIFTPEKLKEIEERAAATVAKRERMNDLIYDLIWRVENKAHSGDESHHTQDSIDNMVRRILNEAIDIYDEEVGYEE